MHIHTYIHTYNMFIPIQLLEVLTHEGEQVCVEEEGVGHEDIRKGPHDAENEQSELHQQLHFH